MNPKKLRQFIRKTLNEEMTGADYKLNKTATSPSQGPSSGDKAVRVIDTIEELKTTLDSVKKLIKKNEQVEHLSKEKAREFIIEASTEIGHVEVLVDVLGGSWEEYLEDISEFIEKVRQEL